MRASTSFSISSPGGIKPIRNQPEEFKAKSRSSLQLPRLERAKTLREFAAARDDLQTVCEDISLNTAIQSWDVVSAEPRARPGSMRSCPGQLTSISSMSKSDFMLSSPSPANGRSPRSSDGPFHKLEVAAVAARKAQLIIVCPKDDSQNAMALPPSLTAPVMMKATTAEEAISCRRKTDLFLLKNAGDLKARALSLFCVSPSDAFQRYLREFP
jgi:hypothetical protein